MRASIPACSRSASGSLTIARLMISAALPWIGALIACRSAKPRCAGLLAVIPADMDAAPKQRLDMTCLARLKLDPVHIAADAREILEIGIDVIAGLALSDAQLSCKAKAGNAIDDAEIDGFGAAAGLAIHLVKRNAEYLGGGAGVNIDTGAERLDHRLFTGHMCDQAQFDL